MRPTPPRPGSPCTDVVVMETCDPRCFSLKGPERLRDQAGPLWPGPAPVGVGAMKPRGLPGGGGACGSNAEVGDQLRNRRRSVPRPWEVREVRHGLEAGAGVRVPGGAGRAWLSPRTLRPPLAPSPRWTFSAVDPGRPDSEKGVSARAPGLDVQRGQAEPEAGLRAGRGRGTRARGAGRGGAGVRRCAGCWGRGSYPAAPRIPLLPTIHSRFALLALFVAPLHPALRPGARAWRVPEFSAFSPSATVPGCLRCSARERPDDAALQPLAQEGLGLRLEASSCCVDPGSGTAAGTVRRRGEGAQSAPRIRAQAPPPAHPLRALLLSGCWGTLCVLPL